MRTKTTIEKVKGRSQIRTTIIITASISEYNAAIRKGTDNPNF